VSNSSPCLPHDLGLIRYDPAAPKGMVGTPGPIPFPFRVGHSPSAKHGDSIRRGCNNKIDFVSGDYLQMVRERTDWE
jgi:hypothetical protein